MKGLLDSSRAQNWLIVSIGHLILKSILQVSNFYAADSFISLSVQTAVADNHHHHCYPLSGVCP